MNSLKVKFDLQTKRLIFPDLDKTNNFQPAINKDNQSSFSTESYSLPPPDFHMSRAILKISRLPIFYPELKPSNVAVKGKINVKSLWKMSSGIKTTCVNNSIFPFSYELPFNISKRQTSKKIPFVGLIFIGFDKTTRIWKGNTANNKIIKSMIRLFCQTASDVERHQRRSAWWKIQSSTKCALVQHMTWKEKLMMGVGGGWGLNESKALKTRGNLQENISLGVVVDVKTLKFNEAFNATSIDLC